MTDIENIYYEVFENTNKKDIADEKEKKELQQKRMILFKRIAALIAICGLILLVLKRLETLKRENNKLNNKIDDVEKNMTNNVNEKYLHFLHVKTDHDDKLDNLKVNLGKTTSDLFGFEKEIDEINRGKNAIRSGRIRIRGYIKRLKELKKDCDTKLKNDVKTKKVIDDEMKKLDIIQKDVIKLWKALLKLESNNRETDPVLKKIHDQIEKGTDDINNLRKKFNI